MNLASLKSEGIELKQHCGTEITKSHCQLQFFWGIKNIWSECWVQNTCIKVTTTKKEKKITVQVFLGIRQILRTCVLGYLEFYV